MVKQIGKLIGVKVTKSTVAKGISKAIPVVGGVISGSLNFASMLPMAKRLAASLDKANFDYTEAEVLQDYEELEEMSKEPSPANAEKNSVKDRAVKGVKHFGEGISGIFTKGKKTDKDAAIPTPTQPEEDAFAKLEKLAKLKDLRAITLEEFDTKKAKLLSRI